MLEQLDQGMSRQGAGRSNEVAKPIPAPQKDTGTKGKKNGCKGENLHKPNSIIFVRRRMLYARPELNGRGEVHFGLRDIRTSSSCQCCRVLELIDN